MNSDSVYLYKSSIGDDLILGFRDLVLRNKVFNKIKNYLGKNFNDLYITKPIYYKISRRNLFLKNKKLPIPSSYLLDSKDMFNLYTFGLNISNKYITKYKRKDINSIVNTIISNNKIKTLKTEIIKCGDDRYISKVIIL